MQILAETGGVARLVEYALDYLAEVEKFDMVQFAKYVADTSNKDLQPAREPAFLCAAEWAIWGLPVDLDSDCDPELLKKAKLSVSQMTIRELTERCGFHTTKHEIKDVRQSCLPCIHVSHIALQRVRIAVPLVLVRTAMQFHRGEHVSPILSAIFLHYRNSGEATTLVDAILCRGGLVRESGRETTTALVLFRLYCLAWETRNALSKMCAVFPPFSYAGSLVVTEPPPPTTAQRYFPKVVVAETLGGRKRRAAMTPDEQTLAAVRHLIVS